MSGAVSESIWLRPSTSGVGRPASHSRDEITAAAIALADRDGLAAVTMRAVAAELGAGAASLYRHIGNRDDLLDLMVDATSADIDPTTPPGRAGLITLGERLLTVMQRHTWLPELVITRSAFGPHGTEVLERWLGLLAEHPAPAADKLEAYALVTAFAATFAQANLSSGGAHTAYLMYAARDGEHPHLAAAVADMGGGVDDVHRFDVTLGKLLDGLLGVER
ncbi:MAG: TetR/AcrR family transcriptional regulator [Micrococcales bacterium]|nr:TetR/AcrR family transcriptional regulator [Micrococcales bacterium]